MPKKLYFSLLLTSSFILTACGSEPSEKDIRAAADNQLRAQVNGLEQLGGKQAVQMSKDLLPEIKSLKKIGCKPDGEKAFNCDVELEILQMGILNKSATSVRLVKGSDGWIVTK